MKYDKYNDNELLYLISQKDDDALEILIQKYHPLIESRLKKFNIKSYNHDDFYQECLIAFYNSIKKFRDDKNGIFNMYLDTAIQNAIKRMLKKESGYFYNVSLTDDLEYVIVEDKTDDRHNLKEPLLGMFSEFEKNIYKKFYYDNLSPKEIAQSMLCEDKRVYNALGRIKQKIKERTFSEEVMKAEKMSDELEKLSGLEYSVFKLYAKGFKTIEIAYELDMSFSKVSNALARAKKKLKK